MSGDRAISVGESRPRSDPDNPNSFPYMHIPGGMANASGYANSVFHAARQDPDGYPARHCEPSWSDQTDWAVKWANEAIEDAELRAAFRAARSEGSTEDCRSEAGFSTTTEGTEASVDRQAVRVRVRSLG